MKKKSVGYLEAKYKSVNRAGARFIPLNLERIEMISENSNLYYSSRYNEKSIFPAREIMFQLQQLLI